MQVAAGLLQQQHGEVPWSQLANIIRSSFETLALRGHAAHAVHHLLASRGDAPEPAVATLSPLLVATAPLLPALLDLARQARRDYQLRGNFGGLAALLKHPTHVAAFVARVGGRARPGAHRPGVLGA
jgi:hypothetical protein